MAKNIKYGKVEFPKSELDEDNLLFRISLMLPLPLIKELKRLSLNETYGGKYQVLIRSILLEHVASSKKAKKRKLA